MANKKLKIGEILVSTGLITEEQLKDALNGQRQLGGTLGENLIRLGYLSEEVLLNSLSEQTGLQHINLSRVEIPPSIQRLVHLESVRSHRLLPIGFEQNRLVVGMVDPTDLSALSEGGVQSGGKTKTGVLSPSPFPGGRPRPSGGTGKPGAGPSPRSSRRKWSRWSTISSRHKGSGSSERISS